MCRVRAQQTLLDRFEDVLVVFERPSDEIGNHVARRSSSIGPEAASKNEEISSLERVRDNRFQDAAVVTGDRFPWTDRYRSHSIAR